PMSRPIDCVVVGSCVVDMLCRPVNLDKPIGHGLLHEVEPILLTAGGGGSHSGGTTARPCMKVGASRYIGRDAWAPVIRNLYRAEGIDDSPLLEHPAAATSTTVVAIDPSGERSFLHCVGAPKLLDAKAMLGQMDLFARAKMMLIGYYSLMPN